MQLFTMDNLRYLMTRIDATYSKFSGSYDDLANKPNIPDEYVLPTGSTTVKGGFFVGEGLYVEDEVLKAKASVQEQANWSEADESAVSFIKNKPTKLSAFENDESYVAKDYVDDAVADATAGMATQSEVETLVSESVADMATNTGVTAVVNSAVDGLASEDYVDNKLTAVYRPCGSVTFANLPIVANAEPGDVYNLLEAFNSTEDFVEGAGHSFPVGTNVVVVEVDGVKKFDAMAGVFDLSNYIKVSDIAEISNEDIDSLFK